MPKIEDGVDGEQHAFAVGTRVSNGAPTPRKLLGFLNRIRHPNGDVDPNHNDIKDIMRQAERDDSDVVVVPRGDGIDVVAGRFLANDHDRNRLIKIGVGVVLGATIVGGAAGFILRKHKR